MTVTVIGSLRTRVVVAFVRIVPGHQYVFEVLMLQIDPRIYDGDYYITAACACLPSLGCIYFVKAPLLSKICVVRLRKKLSVIFLILHRRFSRSLLCSC